MSSDWLRVRCVAGVIRQTADGWTAVCSLTYRWHNRSLPVPAYCRRCTKHHYCSFMLHRGAKKGFRDYLFKDYCRGRLINNAPIYRFLCSNMTNSNIQIFCPTQFSYEEAFLCHKIRLVHCYCSTCCMHLTKFSPVEWIKGGIANFYFLVWGFSLINAPKYILYNVGTL